MKEFPEWAQDLLKSKETGPRPHTLNLSLKLAKPEQLPMMLLDVAVWQPTIRRALKDLAFLHYARFVPSWDGTALVVTTEFDGPMKPYVMDFVIALDDVFNRLLSYVEDKPPLPVQDHPDEFWAYVEKWNRVPFYPRKDDSTTLTFPASYDYPVHSAYPTKSVVDITGARDAQNDGLRPALDRRAAHVPLERVQGNILRSYSLCSVRHLMLKVVDAAKSRAWLANLALTRVQDGHHGNSSETVYPSRINVAFTYDGLKTLLPGRADDLARFPEAFREGAATRAEANGDGKETPSAPAHWRFGGDANVHVVLSLYRSKTMAPGLGDPEFDTLMHDAALNGLQWVHDATAQALPNKRIFFGYRDGISAPRIAGQPVNKGPRQAMMPASSPGEFVLDPDYHSIYAGPSLGDQMPVDLAEHGCYGVLRMIEQDVKGFATLRRKLGRQFKVPPSEAGARLLGRWPHGQPMSLYSQDPGQPTNGWPRNDFDYAPNWEYPNEPLDHQGARCPMDAHIRRTNPRSHHAPGMRHTRRLLRRGLPAKWKEADGRLHGGLMGLFLCGDIERQFEFIQQQWVQGGESGHSDAISGVRSTSTPFRWAPGQTVDIPPLVYTRGSLYLFYPGMHLLQTLPERNEAQIDWKASAQENLDDAEDLAKQRLKALLYPAPWLVEPILNGLLPILSHGDAVEKFVKSLLPKKRSPGDKDPQIKVGALRTRFLQDPCRRYRRLRDNSHNVFWEPEHQAYFALRREDVERILQCDQEFVQSASGGLLKGIITLDGDAHDRVREAFGASMRAPLVNVPTNLDRVLKDQLGKLADLQQFDFVRDLSNPVLSTVFWEFFGLPAKYRDACSGHAAMAMRQFNQPGPRRTGAAAAGANASARLFSLLALELVVAMAHDLLPLHKSPYEGTLLGGVAARTQWFPTGVPQPPNLLGPKRTLTFLEAVTSLLQFVLAGHLAPQLLVSSATYNFLVHDAVPGTSVWRHLANIKPPAAAMVDLDTALDEARRFSPPVTIIQRYTSKEVTIGGITIKKDMPVFAVAASANRDGTANPSLDSFDYTRKPAPVHYSLGLGPHHCIGEAMQRMLVPRMLSTLMAEFPELRLVDPQAVPAWIDNVYFRGLESLPVSTR